MLAGNMKTRTAILLTIPPMLWAGNAIVGRMVAHDVPPILLNFLRWAIALALLLPLAGPIFRRDSAVWPNWQRFAVLGLLGIGLYNALQYLALQSSTPINVTLVASGMPVWMMLTGWLFFGVGVSRRQIAGAVLSIAGVVLVLARGEWAHLLEMRLVAGDLFMILATIAWSLYSWLLTRTTGPADIRANWASFLAAQVGFGVVWSGAFAAGEALIAPASINWSWTLVAALAYVAVGPAIIAFRCWGAGVQQAGPAVAAFFVNLTPLFTALFSSLILGESPHVYHALAFMLIVGGIIISSGRATARR
ncbi:EamA family transporter [Pseudoduganella sp. DS3]|uniref:EamA family transporter n=2 Tax=Pseudoduganella guangdongensis TaxID=2692179 RepID=A0A6N9HK55_9BURK|nr:EamA family transporter [Pseudoduganella guangdongensis]